MLRRSVLQLARAGALAAKQSEVCAASAVQQLVSLLPARLHLTKLTMF